MSSGIGFEQEEGQIQQQERQQQEQSNQDQSLPFQMPNADFAEEAAILRAFEQDGPSEAESVLNESNANMASPSPAKQARLSRGSKNSFDSKHKRRAFKFGYVGDQAQNTGNRDTDELD